MNHYMHSRMKGTILASIYDIVINELIVEIGLLFGKQSFRINFSRLIATKNMLTI